MTRIIAGSARGRRLAVPERGTRPTADRVREAMFSRLEALDAIRKARVLDLYAGSGALALEALSRGARVADLVEANGAAARVCRANVRALGFDARVHGTTVTRFLAGPGEWDLVFADPPYDLSTDDLDAVIAAVGSHLSADAVVVVERSVRAPALAVPPWGGEWKWREYGETTVWLSDLAELGA